MSIVLNSSIVFVWTSRPGTKNEIKPPITFLRVKSGNDCEESTRSYGLFVLFGKEIYPTMSICGAYKRHKSSFYLVKCYQKVTSIIG